MKLSQRTSTEAIISHNCWYFADSCPMPMSILIPANYYLLTFQQHFSLPHSIIMEQLLPNNWSIPTTVSEAPLYDANYIYMTASSIYTWYWTMCKLVFPKQNATQHQQRSNKDSINIECSLYVHDIIQFAIPCHVSSTLIRIKHQTRVKRFRK